MKHLASYIKNIDSGLPVKLNEFYKLLDSLALTHQREPQDVETVKHTKSLYIVTLINAELMSELRLLATDYGTSRTSAAMHNRSHAVNVNGSFILMRSQLNNPLVVMIDDVGEYCSPINLSNEALVIENRQNFIDVEQTVKFLEARTVFKLQPGMNIIFADGNVISNALHKKFLSQYKYIHLCMDVDLGGLMIAKNLMSLLPNTSFSFLVPDDIEQRLARVVLREEKHYIDKVIRLGFSVPLLAPYANLIKNTQKTLEQESYIYGQ